MTHFGLFVDHLSDWGGAGGRGGEWGAGAAVLDCCGNEGARPGLQVLRWAGRREEEQRRERGGKRAVHVEGLMQVAP